MVGLWLGLGQNNGRYLCGRSLVRARVKKEDSLCGRSLVNVRGKKKDDICGMPLVRVKAKLENYILFGWPLVRVEKTPFVADL